MHLASLLQVCTPALNILEDMGVLKELVDNNEAHFADSGGFVSPSGLAYIGGWRAACSIVTSCNPMHWLCHFPLALMKQASKVNSYELLRGDACCQGNPRKSSEALPHAL